MFPLNHVLVVAALSGAVFSFPSLASEMDEYDALRDALVRSQAKKDRPIPKWVKAEDWQPRPHYWLDLKKEQPISNNQPLPVTNEKRD